MKKIIIILINLFLLFSINSEKFRFKYIPGTKFKIEAIIKGKQFQNEVLVVEYDQQYKTVRTIKEFKNNIGTIEDSNYYYNINKAINNQILELKDESVLTYLRDLQGRMKIDSTYSFPTYRNVPYFPDNDIKPGDQWTLPGLEVQDLFSDKTISEFPLKVKYTFLGYETLNNKNYAKFKYEHEVDITNSNQYKIHSRIRRVIGQSETIMYFDNENGTRVKEIYKRDYGFLLLDDYNNLYTAEFIDSGERNWYQVELMDKDKIVDDIKKQLEDEKIEDATVEKDEKGIKIQLENLHFIADSPELLPEEKSRLDKVSRILKNYIDKGIMIIGHTTDKGTEKNRQKLSIERAKVIADYLIDKEAINLNKSSFGGKGGTEPIADNTTEEGMKRNRRVEIYILEE